MLYNVIILCTKEIFMICCFTGHRKIADGDLIKLPELIDRELERLIVAGVTEFRTGGALGFDTLAALRVIEKKKKYPFLRLKLVLPCLNQAERWSPRNRKIYELILSMADEAEYVSEHYTSTCMRERNCRLVDGSDYCLAFCAQESGGSAFTCRYAQEKGLVVINLFGLI